VLFYRKRAGGRVIGATYELWNIGVVVSRRMGQASPDDSRNRASACITRWTDAAAEPGPSPRRPGSKTADDACARRPCDMVCSSLNPARRSKRRAKQRRIARPASAHLRGLQRRRSRAGARDHRISAKRAAIFIDAGIVGPLPGRGEDACMFRPVRGA